MAVEIPVFIDIDKAFQDAASRLPNAIKPLQQFLDSDSNALAIRLKIDDKSKMTLKKILEDTTLSAKNLKTALQDAYAWLDQRVASGGLDLSKGLTESERIHLQALGALEYKVNHVVDASKMMGVVYSANIDRAKAKIIELTNKIDDLTRKQNKYNLLSKKNAPGAKLNYGNTTKQIEQTRAQLEATRVTLGTLEAELEKISVSGQKAARSVGMIQTPAMKMAEEFRRGSEYVERWNASLGTANSRLATLIKGSVSLIALHSATTFIRNVRQVTSEFEMQRVALGGIIQDTERAEQLFKQIKAAAIQSPFEIKDLVSFTKQLSAYRIETENLFDVTMKLADVSAGLGVDMSRLVLAYGQVRAAAVLRGQELRQFTEAGIPLVELLAEKFRKLGREGTTTADVFELISKRAVPFKMIEEIFDDMTSAGGIFYKMQEKQSETLKGQWMKLKDALSIMYDEIGNTKVVHGAMETLLKDAMNLLQNWKEVSKTLGVVVASIIAYRIAIVNTRIAQNALTAAEVSEISALQLNAVSRSRVIKTLFGEAAATKVQIALGNAYVAMKKREMMATNLFTKSLYKMIAALLNNPYAIAIAGAAALVAILVKLALKSKEAAISNDELQKSITKFDKANGHVKDINDLCDAYDKLKAKTERNVEEQKRLQRITRELAKEYPSAINGAKSHAEAMDVDTTAIRKRNEAAREAIRLSLEQDKNRAEQQVKELQDEYSRITDILAAGGVQKGAYGGTWFEPLSEEQKEQYGKRLIYLEGEMDKYGASVEEATNKLEDFKEEFDGHPLPDFFGDAWRTQMNSYATTLKSSGDKITAFTKLQIENFDSAKEALDETAKQYKQQNDLVEFYSKAVETTTGDLKEQMKVKRDDAKLMRDMYGSILTDFNAWSLINKKTSGSHAYEGYIKNMQDQLKFMKDFNKGFEDLSKVMAKDAALAEESGIMLGRGLSLGLSEAEQQRGAEGLSEWYAENIEKVRQKIAKLTGKKNASVLDLLGMRVSDSNKALKDLQSLLQTLWDAKTDLDTNSLKRRLQSELKKLSDEIKHSQEAKDFFQNILNLTGDEGIATSMAISVYGDIGTDFKDRIQRQLNEALSKVSAGNKTDTLVKAIGDRDFKAILENLDKFPEEWQKRLEEMAQSDQKYNAQQIQGWIKDLSAFKTYGDKRVLLAQQTAQKIADINASDLSKGQKKSLILSYQQKEEEEAAKLQYEAFKNSPLYVHLFENLDVASTQMLSHMRDNLRRIKSEWENLDPQNLKEMQRRLNEIDEQLARRNPFKIIASSIKEYNQLTANSSRKDIEREAAFAQQIANAEKERLNELTKVYEEKKNSSKATSEEVEEAKLDMEVQAAIADNAQVTADAAQNTAEELGQAALAISHGAKELEAWVGYINEVGSSIKDVYASFASAENSAFFSQQFDSVSKSLTGIASLGTGLAGIFANPADISSYVRAIKGAVDIVVGINDFFTGNKIKKAEDSIKAQQELLDDLAYAYERLQDAEQKAFGADYISKYNQQLKVLEAQQAAYMEQARLEREKGKKADKDKIKEYENQARDTANQILDMRYQLAEFFAGTDLASAATDFANAWIEAYREFSSTTDAMKEKFQDLIQNMITQSLAAKLMESILDPLFQQIDEMAQSGAMLTPAEIATIANQAPAYIEQINNAMTTLMNQLAAAGYNVRDKVGSLTGISRSIAGASEESINGLAAGINTQNFYMQHIDQNVAAILATLTGGSVSTADGSQVVTDPYKDQMLQYAAYVPLMHDEVAAIRSLLDKVIRPVGTTSNYRMIIG